MNDATFRLWFTRTVPVQLADDAFVIGVPNEFARDWIDRRFAGVVAESLAAVLGAPVAVRFVVDPRSDTGPSPADMVAEPAPMEARDEAPPDAPLADAPADLNPRYVFDRWVIGPHNEYATAVAHSVAESPAGAYNPVFIYAGTGLGKTHLIQAIAHEALVRNPRLHFKYVTVERFTDDFINALTDKGRIDGFKQTYRHNDILLVDDVQFLAEKQQTQVEFFHTFNSLYEAGKQIVITSDRPPRELEALEERLRSRFGQGVVVDIGKPDLETRIAILRRQVRSDGFSISEPESLEYIASHVTTNIRELYGALTRVVSVASVRREPVSLELAKEALQDLLPKPYSAPITIDAIQSEIAHQFGCHIADLRSDKRTQQIAYARQIAMYLCRELTESSLPAIGDRFGGRHHTTVLYSINRIDRALKDGHDRQLHEIIQTVTQRLRTQM